MNEIGEKPQRAAKPSGRQMNWWRRVLFGVLTPVLEICLRLYWLTLKFEIHEHESFDDIVTSGQPVVFAVWHENLLGLSRFVKIVHLRGGWPTFLISPSVDGEIGVMLLARFGGKAVRGSSRRSGAAALRGLNNAIQEERQSPFIALDGSSGPRRYAKPGAIVVSRKAGVPIVPVACAARRAIRLGTWDRHLVPRPFSKVVISVGAPYTVPATMDSDEKERCRQNLEKQLDAQLAAAEEHAGVTPDTIAGTPSEEEA